MVEVASSNLAGPTKHKKARCKRAFLCLKGYHTLELAKPVEKAAIPIFMLSLFVILRWARKSKGISAEIPSYCSM